MYAVIEKYSDGTVEFAEFTQELGARKYYEYWEQKTKDWKGYSIKLVKIEVIEKTERK